MPFQIRISHQAQRDIEQVLAWTLVNVGEGKRGEYEKLIRMALADVAPDPERARRRPELHDMARTLHIARRGMRARHFLLLRLGDDGIVEVGRLLYDGMDLSSQLPRDY